MRYFWACVALAILVLLTPPLTVFWNTYAPAIVGSTELTVFEQLAVDYFFPWGFVLVGIAVIFVGLRMKRTE